MTRDPRVDPVHGDTGQSLDDYVMREVEQVLSGFVYWHRPFGHKTYRMRIETWRRKYRNAATVYPFKEFGAEVIHRAE